MRKRYNLIFVLILGLVLLFSLIACNQSTDPSKLPNNVGDNGNGSSENEQPLNTSAKLRFEFPVEMSSIFNSIYVDEFELSRYVHYTVVYYDTEGVVVKEVPYGGVTLPMVDAQDQPKLSVAGHHDIHVTAELDDNSVVKGTFKLHLKDRGAISLVKYTFNLVDPQTNVEAFPHFGNRDGLAKTVWISLEKGTVIDSWSDFLSAFPMTIKDSDGNVMALQRATDNMVYSATQGFPLTVDSDKNFRLSFTPDVIKVSYDLNVPSDAMLLDEDKDPANLFLPGEDFGDVRVQRNVGMVPKPDDKVLNAYHGYTFAGWFDKKTDKLFRFSTTVGTEDISLYARWVLTEYTFTVYTMGGRFVEGLTNSKSMNNVELTSIDVAKSEKYEIVECTSRFALGTGELNRITFSGFHYNIKYDKYAAEVTVNASGDKVILRFSEIYNIAKNERPIFEKSGNSLKASGLFTDYQCSEKVEIVGDKVNDAQPVTYIKWLLKEDDNPNEAVRNERLSNYYKNVAFKDGYSILADGSVRLDQIKDWDVNELIVPATINVGGADRKITEIGERALANAKAITKLDLSGASNLTTIGREAFAHAQSLKEIVMPKESNISNIGDNAFWDTKFENEFAELNGGAEFIVIGQMLYKYVGADKTEIDLSSPSTYYSANEKMTEADAKKFNEELARITSIEDGAFARCPSLTSISLPGNITTIRNNAFKGLERFSTLNIPDADGNGNGNIKDIGETAFDGTPFLSKASNLNNGGSIIIGNVYYRLINTGATSVDVPGVCNSFNITHIAAEAFKNCSSLADIKYGNEEAIISIGKDAYRDTKKVKTQDEAGNPVESFTVVNHILTEYYGPTLSVTTKNLIVPQDVHTISSYAFGQYARYFESLQIGANVKRIENYAFNGTNLLTKIILTGIGVDANGVSLTNAPSIGEYAFANASGEMRNDLNLYFSPKVMALFKEFAEGKKTPVGDTTKEWFELYKMRSSHFVEDGIETIVIDRSKIADVLIKTTVSENPIDAFTDTYGSEPISNALIITNNTNITRTDSLSVTGNAVKFEKINKPADPNNPKGAEAFWEDGKDKYLVTFTYQGSDKRWGAVVGDVIDKNDPEYFVVTVVNAIKNAPSFTDYKDVYKDSNYEKDGLPKHANEFLNHKDTGDDRTYWFEGLNGQVTEGVSIPTYYTSHNDGEFGILFKYKDVTDTVHTLIPRVTGLSTNVQGNELTATITVDFHGVGTFVFDYKYAVKESRFEGIRQVKPINIPVNTVASEQLRDFVIELVGEDGIPVAVQINSQNFGSYPSFNTTELGMHSVTLTYSRAGETVNPSGLEITVHYTVMLEADANLFEIVPFNESYTPAHARIIGYKGNRNATNVVIPTMWTDKNTGKEYVISQIGYMQGEDSATGVFEGMKNLTSVYLPESIECIGVNAFLGCDNLQHVYTALQSTSEPISIPVTEEYFEDIVELSNYKEFITDDSGNSLEWTVVPVKLRKLPQAEAGRSDTEIIINSDYIYKNSENERIRYRVVEIANEMSLGVNSVNVDVYLPDTIFRAVKLRVSDNDTTPIPDSNIRFYGHHSNFIMKPADYVPETLLDIGTRAFAGCVDLEYLDFSKATQLRAVGSRAFAETGLKSLDFSNNLNYKEINAQTFSHCVALESIKLHDGVTAIGVGAFEHCYLLKEIQGALNMLEHIELDAFNQARSLTRFDLYDVNKLVHVEKGAFGMCSALTIYCHFDKSEVYGINSEGKEYVKLDGINYPQKWHDSWNQYSCPVVWNCDTNNVADDGLIYVVDERGLRYAINTSEQTAVLVGQPYMVSGEVIIPAAIRYNDVDYTVMEIKENAFRNDDTITSVKATKALKKIGANAFNGCVALALFTFEDENGLEFVAPTAFENTPLLAIKPQIA